MHRRFYIFCLDLVVLGVCFLSVVFYGRTAVERRLFEQAALARQEAQRLGRTAVRYLEQRIGAGHTLGDSLVEMGLDPATAASVVGSAQSVFDLHHLRAGNALAVGRTTAGELRAVRYQIDADSALWVLLSSSGFRSEIRPIPSKSEVAPAFGAVRDSLFNAVIDAGESPELALRMAGIFGWDLDFYTDPRPGDTFRLLVERKTYLNGQMAGYGRILAAEYNNAGRVFQAVLFHDPAGRPAYYAPDGDSLQKAFLRSPLKFAAPIRSRFSRSRFHPILRESRPHLGIDYAAPAGTPVQAIGAGRVVFAGPKGTAGNLVHLRHANGYETLYLHLSRVLVHGGERVEQGQRIGLVGSTGLATAPHLDFRMLQNGAYRNFQTLRLPPAQPVAEKDRSEFIAARDRWLPLLPQPSSVQARTTQESPSASAH